MPTSKEFSREVEALALTVTGYEEGRSGQNGLCDCIGLVMGAMKRLGRSSYPIRDTNYFERYQTKNLKPVSNADELQIGHILYKQTSDQSDLNERYKPGGRYYKPDDMFDWYHIGVVTDVHPLEITHCTQDRNISGIKRDVSAKGWSHVGEVIGVDYATDIPVGGKKETTMSKTAYVSVPSGTSTANLRSRPDKSAPLIKRVSSTTVVDVLEQADGWAKIEDPDGNTGYMMLDFLKFLEYADEDTSEPTQETVVDGPSAVDEVTLTIPKDMARTLLKALAEVVV